MKDRVIHVSQETYERLEREATRRGMQIDALADELLRTALDRLEQAADS